MKLNNLFRVPIFCLLTISLANSAARANVQNLTLNPSKDISSPRWLYDSNPTAPVAKNPKLAELMRARENFLKGKFALCAQDLRKAYGKFKSIQPWILVAEVECALEEANTKSNFSVVHPTLATIEKDLSRLFVGPHANRLRTGWIQGRLGLLNSDIKSNRARAWGSVEKLQKVLNFLDKKDKGSLYRAMGELAFVQQRWDAAREFFERSVQEFDNEEVRNRLKAVESVLPKKEKTDSPQAKVEQITNPALEVTADELELVQKVTVALGTGELLSAVEEAIKIIKQFPGGVRAKWASDRVLEVYLSLVDKSDPKFAPIREGVVNSMTKADSGRVTEWSRVIYNRAQYSDSLKLAEAAIASAEAGVPNARLYELAADSALNVEKYSDAKKYYQILITQYGGTTPAREALLRSALIDYRKGEYISAVTQLERLLVLPQTENYEVVARYWLWRALQKLKSDQATTAVDQLIRKYPFSYYGLRAQLEKNNGVLEKTAGKETLNTNLWLTATERETIERVKLLLSAGWLEEAQSELKTLADPVSPRDKASMALVFAAAAGYGSAVRLANEAWDEDPSLRKEPLYSVAFPNEFKSEIAKQAGERKIQPSLIASLIKQESAYQVKAVSSSSAFGLMQMIAPTAKEVAGELKIQEIQIPRDLFKPATNIRMGTYYLSELLQRYNGHVPLALASYNAGPTRIDRWIKSRDSLQKLSFNRSANPDDELWFDEIPWSETSFYVKAILRNMILYQLFEHGKIEASFPAWNEGAVKKRD